MKKRCFSAFLILVILVSLLSVGASGAYSKGGAVVTAKVDGVDILATDVEGDKYLFLPASADLTRLYVSVRLSGSDTITLRGTKGSASTEDFVNIIAIAEQDQSSRYVLSAETEYGGHLRIYIMQGGSISTIYLSSGDVKEDREWVDLSKENETTGRMKMLGADGTDIYDGNLTQIKTRGNSSFELATKKSYQIKLDKKSDLLGKGEKVKTWVLLANYFDASMMHDKLFKDLASNLGMKYTASCDWVNLYYDGEYRGVYLLSEKNSVGSTSVDITDMEDAYDSVNVNYGENMVTAEGLNRFGEKIVYTKYLTEPDNITGGYLIERNNTTIDEASGFFTLRKAAFNVKSPEWAGREAMEYISGYYQEFENAVYATDENGNYTGYNKETGKYYYEYCDLESLVQTYIIQQLSLNIDAYVKSFFFYKDAGEIMYAGPIWDMDFTCGTGMAREISVYENNVDSKYLAIALSKIPSFVEAVEEYFTLTFASEMEKLTGNDGVLAQYEERLSANVAMNFVIWPYVKGGLSEYPNYLWGTGTNHGHISVILNSWLVLRGEILNEKFNIMPFTDICPADWEYSAVYMATSRGILNGVAEQRFGPDESTTRGMFFTALARIANQETTPAQDEHWQQPGLDWAVENGISDGSNPNAAITREQIATMLYRYIGEPISNGNLEGFTDYNEVSYWAESAMEWAVSEGIFKGYDDGTLKPTGTATRAEIAQILVNFTNLYVM